MRGWGLVEDQVKVASLGAMGSTDRSSRSDGTQLRIFYRLDSHDIGEVREGRR